MDYKKTACLVWPVLGTDIPEAHVTVIFLGEIVGVEGRFLRVISALSQLYGSAPGEVETIGVELFGTPEKPVWVATLADDGLVEYQSAVEDELAEYGIENASSFSTFAPHVTYGLEKPSSIPKTFYLGKPVLWWGPHKLPLAHLGI